ncbi:MAG TPA: hypothetical protein VI793_06200 [Anaerolineales bacterium]|nr:hypothetical protein [Anaerolineales bacterium]
MADAVTKFYICPNCFLADTAPGQCPNCGHTRVECDPGNPDNPCRKPPMDAEGNITSRAPLWWLARSVPHLREKIRQMMNR